VDGSVLVVGNAYDEGQYSDLIAIRYDSEGEVFWSEVYRDLGGRIDQGHALYLDDNGDFYVAGSSYRDSQTRDFLAMRCNNAGEVLWAHHFDVEQGSDDVATGLTVSADGHLYVTGYSSRDSSYRDIVTVQFGFEGHPLATVRRAGSAGRDDTPAAIVAGPDGEVYIAGTTWEQDSGSDMTLIRYAAGSVGFQLPSDCNADGILDISDGICLLGHLFLGTPSELPCGNGQLSDAMNVLLLDCNGDGVVNVSDAVRLFGFLFNSAAPHALGVRCRPLPRCPNSCSTGD
jgi:hypothetical protein